MRKAAVRHPVVASVFVIVLFIISMLLGNVLLSIAPPFFRNNGDILLNFTAETVVCLMGIILMAVFGYLPTFYRTEKFGTGLACSAYFIIIYALNAVISVGYEITNRGSTFFADLLPLWRILLLPLYVLSIGLAEEAFFRGIIANLFWDKHAKDPAGVRTAAIYSGIIFGLMHFMNAVAADLVGVLVQVISAIFIGIAITAIYYRCRNIWVTILLHAFMDGCALISIGLFGGTVLDEISSYSATNIIQVMIGIIPYIIVSAVLLRKKKVIPILAGENAVGFIPQQPGSIVVGVDMKSSPESKKSFARAVVILVLITLVCFSVALIKSPEFSGFYAEITGKVAADFHNTEEWAPGSEPTVGKGQEFDVTEPGDYKVTLDTMPSDSRVDMVLQITEDGKEVYTGSFGGICSVTFDVYLNEGKHDVNLVYSFANLDKACTVDTTVKIVKD